MSRLILWFLLMVVLLSLGFILFARYLEKNFFQEWDLVNQIPWAIIVLVLVSGLVGTFFGSGSDVAGKDTTGGNQFKSDSSSSDSPPYGNFPSGGSPGGPNGPQ
jgi:hypothetical protein